MSPERWRKIEQLYHAALEREPPQRAPSLSRAAGSDEELRREVESLLAQNVSRDALLDRPAWEGAGVAAAPGAQLGPYRIEGPLGAGGMGRVYRALDTRLDRPVAMKVVAEEFSNRFEREARAISGLNHPHICTLYDVGPGYLIMELVEGETLEARLQKGCLPMEVVLRYGAEVADALAAAHARGIIHRDLKPGNLMVTKSGIKVLDFGLAKITQANETLTASHVIQGTPAYMAPEQLEGKPCDARTDIFALGLVLYEMAAGKRLRQGETASLDKFPERFAHVIERCLEKEPDDRWQSARDLKAELEWAGKSGASPQQKARPSRGWLWGFAAAAGAGLLLTFVLLFRHSAELRHPVRLSFSIPGVSSPGLPIPSPGGSRFLLLAQDADGRRSLWVRPLGSGTAQQLPGTEDAELPFWRSDGRWIGFYARGKLWKIDPDGGTPQTLIALQNRPFGAAWNATGDLIFARDNRSGLFRARESAGVIEPLTRLDLSRTENSHRHMHFLPDGRRYLFVARCGRRENNASYVRSLDSGETHRVMAVQSNVSYVSPQDGQLATILYVRDGTLVQHQFDGQNAIGEPAAIVENVLYTATAAYAAFAVSSDGRVLVFSVANSGPAQMVWFDREGQARGTLGPPGDYKQPRISPDGTRVLYGRPDEHTGNRDVWYIESERAIAQRLTTDPANDWFPVWSPDGRSVLFGSDRAGGPGHAVYIKRSTGPSAGEARLFDLPDANFQPTDWGRPGGWVALASWRGTNADIWTLPLSGARVPFAFLATPFNEDSPRFSPDAKWIAYVSNESGRSEVCVRRFFGQPAVLDKIQISTGGGDFPVWRSDGTELFYIGGDLKIYAIRTADFARAGVVPRPMPLFDPCVDTSLRALPLRNAPDSHPYDVSPDGQRFLFLCNTDATDRYEVLLDWMVKG